MRSMNKPQSEQIFKINDARTINVLRVAFVQGKGTEEDPLRLMYRFYLENGRYIGEISASN